MEPSHETKGIIFEPPRPLTFDYKTKMFSAWKQKHENDNEVVTQLGKKMPLKRTEPRLQGQKKVESTLGWNKS